MQASGISLESLGKAMATIAERDGIQSAVRARDRADHRGRRSSLRLSDQLSAERGSRSSSMASASATSSISSRTSAMIEYMRELRGRGYKMAICTNNIREWEAHWRAMLPVDEIFDVVVDSAFVGSRKPEPRIYEITLERLGAHARGDAVHRRRRGQLRGRAPARHRPRSGSDRPNRRSRRSRRRWRR